MAKHIDADKVYKMLNAIGGCGAEPESWADGWDKAIDAAIKELDEIPSADVRPERYAHWTNSDYKAETMDGETVVVHDPIDYRCSNCGGAAGIRENFLYPYNAHDLLYPFCPYCGAKMSGKENNNDRVEV